MKNTQKIMIVSNIAPPISRFPLWRALVLFGRPGKAQGDILKVAVKYAEKLKKDKP